MKKILIPLAVTLVFWGCSPKDGTKEKNQNQKKVVVTTQQSVEKKYHPWLEYTGVAFAYKEANLGTTLPGKVEKIHFEEGQRVNKGDLIVELSAELYAQALAEKNTLEKDFERVSRLKEKGSVTQQKYDHVKAKLEAARAKTRMMKKNSEVRAPFSGTIVDYLVKEGENFMFSPSLKPGYSHTSGIVQLMQLDKLKIEIDVNEQDLSEIKTGQKAEVVFDAFPDKTMEGTVTHIEPVLSTTTHTAKAEITITNPEHKLKPGMYSRVKLRMPETTNVFIPLNAIYRQPGTGNNYVFVVSENQKVTRMPVQKLYTMGKDVAVKGIEGGKEIVVHGKNKLKDGDIVNIKNQ
jgi:membrane fusion protein (multidrug efflux system)